MKNLSLLTSVWSIIIGAYLLLFTPHGIIVVCIACGSPLTNILATVSVIVGVIGVLKNINAGSIAQR